MVPDVIRKVLAGTRPLPIFGSGEQTRTLTHVDDIAAGIVTAMRHPAAENEDFNVSASEEHTVAEIARIIWEACGEDPAAFELEHLPSFEVDVQRRWPSVEKARRLLGWEAQIGAARGDRGHGRVATRARACSPWPARAARRPTRSTRARSSPAARASPGATCSTCCPGRPRRRATSSTCSTPPR